MHRFVALPIFWLFLFAVRRRLQRRLLYCFIVSLGIWQFACWFFMTIMYVNFRRAFHALNSSSRPTQPKGKEKKRKSERVYIYMCVCVCSCICSWAPLAGIWLTRFLNTFGHFHSSQPRKKSKREKKLRARTRARTLRTSIFSFSLWLFTCMYICMYVCINLYVFFMLCIKVEFINFKALTSFTRPNNNNNNNKGRNNRN